MPSATIVMFSTICVHALARVLFLIPADSMTRISFLDGSRRPGPRVCGVERGDGQHGEINIGMLFVLIRVLLLVSLIVIIMLIKVCLVVVI